MLIFLFETKGSIIQICNKDKDGFEAQLVFLKSGKTLYTLYGDPNEIQKRILAAQK